ncbi:DNRLRE domain-containing protein [Sorangium sp. So ce134]
MRAVAMVLGAACVCLAAPSARAAPEAICTTIQRGLLGTVEDTYIRQASPGYAPGSDVYTRSGFRDGSEARALYRFDLSFIPPDAVVLSAMFTTTVYSSGVAPIYAHRVTAAWTEAGATWGGLSTQFSPEVEGAFDGIPYGFASLDLTSLVQRWVDGSQANFGFLLAEDAPARTNYRSSEHPDPDSRPHLEICYILSDCGDGALSGEEECDDGNAADDDGCSLDCTVESGYSCAGAPSACSTLCGDGVTAGPEACDDGDAAGGDGCSAACLVEAGYACTGAPSACSTVCGDGIRAGAEACDDGDAAGGDGCSAACLIESGYACAGSPSVCTCANGTPCDDGNACTQTDVCTGGACVGTSPVTCLPPGDCAEGGACDAATGACAYTPKPDGSACASNGVCNAGACDSSSLVIEVFDMSGMPIVGATVAYGVQQLTTNEDGAVVLDALEGPHVVAQVTATGYAPVSVVEDLRAGADRTATVNLLALSTPIPMRTDVSAEVITDTVAVTVPPNSLVDELGQTVTGVVGVTVVPLDPATDDIAGMPGPLEGITEWGERSDLASLFMAEVSFWKDGEPLQLAEGATARIEFVLPDALQEVLNPGDTIDAWWFDLTDGIWRREGAGTIEASTIQLGKLAWVAEVSHFTWWNVDYSINGFSYNCVKVRVLNESSDEEMEDVKVRAVGVNYDNYYVYQLVGSLVDVDVTGATGEAGTACVNTMRGGTSRIMVSADGYSIHSYAVGSLDGYTVVSDAASPTVITNGNARSCSGGLSCLDMTVYLTPLTCMSGQVRRDPDGVGPAPETPVSGANVYATYIDQKRPVSHRAITDNSGNYCVSVPSGTMTSEGPADTAVRLRAVKAVDAGAKHYVNGEAVVLVPATNVPRTCSSTTGNGCVSVPAIRLTAQNGGTEWTYAFGNNGSQSVTDVAVDPRSGAIYMTGNFNGRITFDKGYQTSSSTDEDAFLVKLQPDGTPVWSKTFSGAGLQESAALALDSAGNVVVVGSFEGTINIDGLSHVSAGFVDGFVAKFSPDGARQWSSRFGAGGNQRPKDVAVDTYNPDASIFGDNITVVGYYDGSLGPVCGYCGSDAYECSDLCPDATGEDIFVLKLFKGGNRLLGTTFGGSGRQRAMAVALDEIGDMVLTGEYEQNLSFREPPGRPQLSAVGMFDMFVAKLSPSGEYRWSSGHGDAGGYAISDQRGVAIAASTSSVIVSGNFTNSISFGGTGYNGFVADVFVARFTGGGVPDWIVRSGVDNEQQRIADIGVDENGNILLVGSAVGPVKFDTPTPLGPIGIEDMYVAKLSSQGSPLWSRRYGNTGAFAHTPSVAISSGTVVVAANFGRAAINFGNNTVEPAEPGTGRTDIAVSKLYP